jgi:glycosyltransferase involved in cell wall biosynthesis
MKLIVNIPAYNEEEHISQTIQRIRDSFQDNFYTTGEGSVIKEKLIQVVDDGSKDATIAKAKAAGADIIIPHLLNRRLGIVFRTAVENALNQNADLMVNIDADGQFDPLDIPKLLKPILKHEYDMVIASRFGKYQAKDIPWIKEALNKFAAKIISIFLNYPIDDLTCGFRAHNRETLLRLNLSSVFTYTQETIIDAIGKNLKLTWVPVKVTYFANRKSRMVKSVWQFVNNSFKIILKAVRDVRPLKFFGWPGLILLALSFLGFCVFFYHYVQDFKISPYLNYIIFSSVTLLLGIQLLIFALIADMIRSSRQLTEDLMYQQKKARSNQPID